MGFMFYDISFLIIFSIAVVWFLLRHRKKLGREGPIFLYRTKIGLQIIDSISRKYSNLLKSMKYIVVGTAYALLVIMLYLLFQIVGIFAKPEYVQMIKIPPLMPFIPYLPEMFNVTWLPPLYFTYWIVITAVIALVHEGFHGIYSRLYNIRVKSTGFGFLGPILTFFVEPDEKQIQKAKTFDQMTMLGAGVFGNMVAAIAFFIIMVLFFNLMYAPSGALFNTYSYSTVDVSAIGDAARGTEKIFLDGMNFTQITFDNHSYYVWDGHLQSISDYEKGYINIYLDMPAIHAKISGAISKIDDTEVKNSEELGEALKKYKPGDEIIVQTKNKTQTQEYAIKLGEDYNTKGRAVIGIGVIGPDISGIRGFFYKMINSFRNPAVYYEPKAAPELTEFAYYLFWWLVLINIGVALFNILPVALTDGGRFWYLTVLAITKKESIAKGAFKAATGIILFVFLLLMVLWVIGMF